MTSDILQNILSEEAQASEIHLEAQQTANEIVKNAETRAGDEERKAAVENRALYQRLLEERRLRVEQQLQNQQQKNQQEASAHIKAAGVNLDKAVQYIMQEVVHGNR